jgi:3'-5' exoribonuclease
MQVREFCDGADVAQALLVREVQRSRKRDGSEYLRLKLGDKTALCPAVLWELPADLQVEVGHVLHVQGRFEVHARYGGQLILRAVRLAADGEYDPALLHAGPPRSARQMETDLRALVATVQHRHLRALLDGFLGEESQTWPRYRDAPAAKFFHQAYRHGLLEHCLTVAQAVSAISATFPGIDRDVAVAGALLHDIGKLEAYTSDPFAIDMTDAGKLLGEIPLGYYTVRRAIEDIDGFPADTAQALLHIILSHHGQLEHGSPVVPCTREATLVHMCDNLGGRLGSFDRLEKELADGQAWSSFDRAIGGGAYFGERALQPAAANEASAAA